MTGANHGVRTVVTTHGHDKRVVNNDLTRLATSSILVLRIIRDGVHCRRVKLECEKQMVQTSSALKIQKTVRQRQAKRRVLLLKKIARAEELQRVEDNRSETHHDRKAL